MIIFPNKEEKEIMDTSISSRLRINFIYNKDSGDKDYWETFSENFGSEVKSMLRKALSERGQKFQAGFTIKNGEVVENGD